MEPSEVFGFPVVSGSFVAFRSSDVATSNEGISREAALGAAVLEAAALDVAVLDAAALDVAVLGATFLDVAVLDVAVFGEAFLDVAALGEGRAAVNVREEVVDRVIPSPRT